MKTGQWVEVRGKEEILRTLDKNGRLEGLPFMPQMFDYCGKRFRIYKVAHKACDSAIVDNALRYKGRKMERTVFLEELRCNGAAYDGCGAACLIFWKEAWLKASAEELARPRSEQDTSEADVRAGTREGNNYICQATQLAAATTPLSPFDLKVYLDDYRSGNVGLWPMCRSFIYAGYNYLCNAGLKIGRPLRFLYDTFQGLYGGLPYPAKRGKIPPGQTTPVEKLNLQPGEWVRVKSYPEILTTLDSHNLNRGMSFVPDQVPYCGRTFRVYKRVTQIVNERTGKMLKLKTPSILLEGAVCAGRYTGFCLFCPRNTHPYWREIWLERVSSPVNQNFLGNG